MQFVALAFLAAAVLEVLSVVFVAGWLGGWATFGLMVLSFAAGLFILRRTAGFAKVLMAGEMMRGGSVSFYQLMWPVRIPAAGVLLMLPGFVSTAAALLLLLPLKGRSSVRGDAFGGRPAQTAANRGEVIDSEDYVVRGGTRKGREQDVIEHRP